MAKRAISPSKASVRERSKSRSPLQGVEQGMKSSNDASLTSDHSETDAIDQATSAESVDDGWEAIWEDSVGAYYFYNRFTKISSWSNPRAPAGESEATGCPAAAPGVSSSTLTSYTTAQHQPRASASGFTSRPARETYNPAIHGDYDPSAAYAQDPTPESPAQHHHPLPLAGYPAPAAADDTAAYASTGQFNRFTGRWQAADAGPDRHNDENKSKRQLNAFFDVDAAANAHEGKSLRAERSGKKLSKQELQAFKEKRRDRKEEKRRAWLRD